MKRIVLLVGLSIPTAAIAEIISIPAVYDTTLEEGSPTSNFGTRDSLRAGGNVGGRARALVFFDIGAVIPPGATIQSVRPTFIASNASSTTQTFELHRVNKPWTAGAGNGTTAAVNEATWTHRLYSSTAWASPGGASATDYAATASATRAIGDAGNWRFETTGSLVADVQGWLDRPEANLGWLLIAAVESSGAPVRTFSSCESTTGRPALEIEFSTYSLMDFRVTSIQKVGGNTTLTWVGGGPPYQVMSRPSLSSGDWTPVGSMVSGLTATVPSSTANCYFTVISEPVAEYDVTFSNNWTSASHPTDYPATAHWSGMVGGLHNNRVEFWRPGATASLGLQNVAERGQKTELLNEVAAAISTGNANRTLSGGANGTTLRFQINRTHPLVTLVAMLAPSPDWFAGVRGLPLVENGQWVSSKAVSLYAWDTGTDSGASYTSPDLVTSPRGVITRLVIPPLGNNGYAPPVATFTFTLVRIVRACSW